MANSLNVTYNTIKSVLGKIPSYYVPQGDGGYSLYAVGESTFIQALLLGSNTSDISNFESTYKNNCTATSSADDAYLLGLTANSVPLVTPRTAGLVRTASEKTSYGSRSNFYSHNWCDPTTWYSGSTYVSSETATNSGNNLKYTLAHTNVIDTYHGKITLEDSLKSASGNSYRVSVRVNNVLKTEQDPHNEYSNRVLGKSLSLGHYTIDYKLGEITFLSALDPSDVVTVTYHYAGSSLFKVAPLPGKQLTVTLAEVQLSMPIELQDSVAFEVWGIADYFLSPAQMTALGIPSGIGYKIPLSQFLYKTINDFQNDAFRAYPRYGAMGTSDNWRALTDEVVVFDWDYIKSDALYSSKGMEIRMSLQHDQPFEGTMATVTLYCIAEPEI